MHQPQLTEDRTLYPLLDRVVGDYRAWFAESRPLVVPTLTQAGQELVRQQRWSEAVSAGRVRAWLEDGSVTVAVDGGGLDVPLTTGPGAHGPDGAGFGAPYGVGRSAWVPVTGEHRLTTAVSPA